MNNENKILQEDCSEDSVGTGILTLTDKRIAFDKTKGRIADFSKKIGDTVIDIPLEQIVEVGKEGRLIKKVWIKAKIDNTEKIYKFGVYNTKKWLQILQQNLPKN